MKKTVTVLILTIIIVSCVLVKTLSASDVDAKIVGVKKGDWVEYSMKITGPQVDALRNITWYRCDVLEVDGSSFLVNKTALMVNGTLQSSVWQFNLTAGQVFGWVIIPANLSIGETFYDNFKLANITIESEEPQTLLGATRTVTQGSIAGMVDKEWDKTTGVYIHAVEQTTDYTIITQAVATNMWTPETPEENMTILYQSAAAITLAIMVLLGTVFVAGKKRSKRKPHGFSTYF